ncbi:hypothetical protein M758_9G181300 [Ceratodon purpureus]|uniref:Uncharacterized protein n=1 Tax=Ceratodon purpureus TaxID=3225 RepID=A0A8T0GYW9_CERPU|nr:hypothetical protein KC19_9G184600 [Ceratodon purpureus]KAG0606946.1 hypothetical protein M758_9G181300 [Ceratodon purpureus]
MHTAVSVPTPSHSSALCYNYESMLPRLAKRLAFFNGLLSCGKIKLFPSMDVHCLGNHQTKYLTSTQRRPRPTQYEESTSSLLIRNVKQMFTAVQVLLRELEHQLRANPIQHHRSTFLQRFRRLPIQ